MSVYRTFSRLLVAAAALLSSGCAYLTHFNTQRSVLGGDAQAMFVDAKQRTVIAARRENQEALFLREARQSALRKASLASQMASKLAATKPPPADEILRLTNQEKYYLDYAAFAGQRLLSGRYGGPDQDLVAFCAEPSPDALSAISASGAFKANWQGGATAAFQQAISEAASSIGLRTQSIQLMRDAMYRICEGYMNGALGGAGFETLHRRFQNSMVAILAIEQITGVVRAPAAALEGLSSAGVAGDLVELTKIEAEASDIVNQRKAAETSAKEEVSRIEMQIAALEAEGPETAEPADSAAEAEDEAGGEGAESGDGAEPAGATPEESPAEKLQKELGIAREKLGAQTKSRQEAEKTLASVTETLEAARQGRVTAATRAYFEDLGGSQSYLAHARDASSVKHVTEAVDKIVSSFFRESYIDEVCTSIFTGMADGSIDPLTSELFAQEFDYRQKASNGMPNGLIDKKNLFTLCEGHIAGDVDEYEARALEAIQKANDKERDAEKKVKLAEARAAKAERDATTAERQKSDAVEAMKTAVQKTKSLVDSATANTKAAKAERKVAEAERAAAEAEAESIKAALDKFRVQYAGVNLSAAEREKKCREYIKSGILGQWKDQEAKKLCYQDIEALDELTKVTLPD